MSGARRYNFEPEKSLEKRFVLASRTIPTMLEVSSFKKERESQPPQTIDHIIDNLFVQIDNEIIIPILKSENLDSLIEQINAKFNEFYDLRQSIIFAFTSYVYKSDKEKEEENILEKRCKEGIKKFFASRANEQIGEDAAMAVSFSLETMEIINRVLNEENINELYEKNFKTFHRIDAARSYFDLFMTCLISGLMDNSKFKSNVEILRGLAFFARSMSKKCYVYAKKIGAIKYPRPKSINLKSIKSDLEDIELADAGLNDYVSILDKEDLD